VKNQAQCSQKNKYFSKFHDFHDFGCSVPKLIFVLKAITNKKPNTNMNNFTKIIPARLRSTLACSILAATTFLIQSCSKDTAPVVEISYLSLVNATPTLGTFNAYVDQTKITNAGPLSFASAVSYFQAAPGSHTVKFTTASSTDALISKSITLDVNKAYSLFLINKAPNLDYLLTPDQINNAASDKAFVRFINLSPDAPALNLNVKDVATALIADQAYKAVSNFIETEAKSYIFQLKNKATGNAVGENDLTFELKAGKTYTVMAVGMVTAGEADQKVQLKVITNQ
jgi:hypothetical protein